MTNIFHLEEGVGQSLQINILDNSYFHDDTSNSHSALQVAAPILGEGSSWLGWTVSLPEIFKKRCFKKSNLCRPTDGDDHI